MCDPSTPKKAEVINWEIISYHFDKAGGYKITISIVFLYISNNLLKILFLEITFTIAVLGVIELIIFFF